MSSDANLAKIVAVVGPTGSGKTALSLEIAHHFNGEIVSADSRQVYRGMDIGTAKPTRKEVSAVPHHLVDIKNPDEEYTAAEYKDDAIAAIQNILKRGKLPVLVGGTGLYIKAVLENLDIPKVKSDPELRQKIESEVAERGLDAIFKKLVELDPEATYVVDPKNPRRVVRALEVALITGRPFTAQRQKQEPLFNALEIGVNTPPEVLRERINARVDEMIKKGLLVEVKDLVEKYGRDRIAFDAIGYREVVERLAGKISLAEAAVKMKLDTWHYARRQMTWFRKDKNVRWVDDPKEASKLVELFIKQ